MDSTEHPSICSNKERIKGFSSEAIDLLTIHGNSRWSMKEENMKTGYLLEHIKNC